MHADDAAESAGPPEGAPGMGISRWHRSQQHEQRRLRLLESLIRGDALALQLAQLALDHEAAFPDSLCSVLLLDATGRLLQHGAAPNLPDFYNQAIHGLEIGPDRGACGGAAHSGQRVICENLATDPRWAPYLPLVQRAGLGACWSTPVIGAGGQALGTFAAYRRQPARPADASSLSMTLPAGAWAMTARPSPPCGSGMSRPSSTMHRSPCSWRR